MTEWAIGWLGSLKLLLIAVVATLYWIGGRAGSPGLRIRRWGGGLLLSLGTLGFAVWQSTFDWWMLGIIPHTVLALSLGYGGGFKERLLFGSALGSVGLWIALSTGVWNLLILQFAVAVLANVMLGLLNPVEAAEEETLIAVLSTAAVPFMV